LSEGKSLVIPPGYIHAVITVEESAIITMDIVREDWMDLVKDGMNKEFALIEEGLLRGDCLNEASWRWRTGIDMWKKMKVNNDVGLREKLESLINTAESKLSCFGHRGKK
jgi:hypothetical protein